MRLDGLQVELRPRSPWEAMELGTALVRHNAAPIWRAWLLASLPVFVLCNALGWALDRLWLASLVMWWLKPAFDRVPLFVLSRAVFGQRAGVRESAWAAWRFGRASLLRDLTWGRIGLRRSLLLPVSLLEGASGALLRERRKVLSAQGGESAVWLTLLCLHFEAVLMLAAFALIPMFVPVEYLSESARAVWELVFEAPPPWAQLAMNVVLWGATTFIEPFYVGAGFGLYLNRRTQLEAWDIEIAFRRLRARLASVARVACVALAMSGMLGFGMAPARAADDVAVPAASNNKPAASDEKKQQATQLPAMAYPQVFGEDGAEPAQFQRAAAQAYRDPLLRPVRKERSWVPKTKQADTSSRGPFAWLGALAGIVSETVLWGLLALAVLWLLWKIPRWWPELWRPLPKSAHVQGPVHESEVPHHDTLPGDIVATARRLWREGRPRAALALLYRASVEAMAVRTGTALAPGATEAECLRASRRMPDAADRGLFAEVVRTWQQAAYAQRLPDAGGFEDLLVRGAARFGWAA